MIHMIVFEAPDQTAKAILGKYQESFLENNDEYDEQWLKLAEKDPKKAMKDLDWWMQEDFALLTKMGKAVQDGKIPEGASEWLINQVIPVELFGTYQATQNPPPGRQNLIWPEDQDRALETFNWYMTNRKESDVQNRMRERFPGRNIKNPLEFSIWDMEDVEASLTPESEAEARNERWMPSEMGLKASQADVAFNEGDIMIVKVTGADAASKYASGTKWCTSNKSTAQSYLNRGPLYVVFRNGQKYGQIHTQDNQVMDLQDRPLNDLPPAVATFMVRADREHLKELLNNWPSKDDIIKKLRDGRRDSYQNNKTMAENRLTKALGIYEGNNVDEDSYSRFFMKRLYGSVDTQSIRTEIANQQELLDGVDTEEIPQYNIDNETNTTYNDLSNTLRGLNNMVDRVSAPERRKLQLITEADLELIQKKLKEVGRSIDFGDISSIVATLPPNDATKKLNRDRITSTMGSWQTNGAMREGLEFAVVSSGNYDVESFDPELYKILREYVRSGEGSRYGVGSNTELEIPYPSGVILSRMLRKKKTGINLGPFQVWFLKQEPAFIKATLSRLEQEAHFRELLNDVGHPSLDPAKQDVEEYDSTSLIGLSVLPEPIREIFVDTFVRGIQSGHITDEMLNYNYQTANWGNTANLSNAVVELAATLSPQKEQEVMARLKAGPSDLTIRQRAKRWLSNHNTNPNSSKATAYTTQPLFTDKGYRMLKSPKILKDMKDHGYYMSLEGSNGEKIYLLSTVAEWNQRFAERFDIKPYNDSDGEIISPFMPLLDLDDGGDEFGDLKEEILLGVDDPDIGLSPNSSGDVSKYLHTYIEPFIGEERLIKQANAKGMVRPPAYIGWGCVCCGLPIEYDASDKTWKTPEGVTANDREFGDRWDWQLSYPIQDDGGGGKTFPAPPQKSCIELDQLGKYLVYNDGRRSSSYNSNNVTHKFPMVKKGQRPHLAPGIAASSLWCTKCYGWRPVSQEVRNSYQSQSMEWEILRSARPCKCGYTKASLKLYEAEDYEPTEAEITAEITGALGSGGPRGLNQTAYEAEYTRIAGDDMDDYLVDLGFQELPRMPRRERIYQKLYGRGPDGAELFTRVYTSIVDGAVSGARDVGRDAIRVVPIYIHPTFGEFALAKNRRVHRVLGWRKNLADRIQTSENAAPGPVLDSNGKPMRLRKNRRTGQHFWGSIDYPNNLETKPYRG